MYRDHNILVRKHLNVSFPATVKLLKVSGMMYFLIFYLFWLPYLFFFFFPENLTPLQGSKYIESSFASFQEMLWSL